MKREVKQIRKLERKGDFYYVKIHRVWIEDFLRLKDSSLVDVSIKKPEDIEIPKYALENFKSNFTELKKISDKLLKSIMNTIRIEKGITQDVDEWRAERLIEAFENELRRTKGAKFVRDYKLFKKIVTSDGIKRLVKNARQIKNKEFQEEYKIGLKIAKMRGIKI